MADPVRRVSCGAAAWGGRARRAGRWASPGACPAHVCASRGLPAAGRAARGREVPGRRQDPPRPVSGDPTAALPAGCPALSRCTVLKGCLEKQPLRGERRGSDLRSGGEKSKDPHWGPSHGVSPGKPLRPHPAPFRALRTTEARLGAEDGGEDVLAPPRLRKRGPGLVLEGGRVAQRPASLVTGSPSLRVPRLGPAAQRGDGPSLCTDMLLRDDLGTTVHKMTGTWELTSEDSSSASSLPRAHQR